MKIVVLDGYTLNPGDLSWSGLEQLGDVTVYDRTWPGDVLQRSEDADVLLTNKTLITGEAIHQLPALKYIGVLATGYNIVDTDAAKQRKVVVANVPGYGTASVVQLTFALLLELCHHVQYHSDAVRRGRWSRSADFSFWNYPLMELSGKTMGIIGFGNIGQKVAAVAAAFGMEVLVTSRSKTNYFGASNYRWAELPELLKKSDVVTIHCPLVPETKGLIDAAALRSMKPGAFLLNTSRGPIIVEDDVADALNNDVIAGAGIDVLSVEPPPETNPLLRAKNCLITPHIAWATKEARQRLMDAAVENLASFVKGNPVNIVSPYNNNE